MGKTTIEWTQKVWNPLRGCTKVSEGCRNCYAMGIAARFSGPGLAYEGLGKMTPSGPAWTNKVKFVEEHLEDPLKWRKPCKVFVNSMSDLFHEDVEDYIIDQIFGVMAAAPKHTFQVLTKRPERMLNYLTKGETAAQVECLQEFYISEHCDLLNRRTDDLRATAHDIDTDKPLCLPNVWLGTSVENQATANERIPFLVQTPAAVRFLSCEPLLGPIVIDERWTTRGWTPAEGRFRAPIDWVIAGAESGRGARPMDEDWVRSLRDQCTDSVAFFYKQNTVVDGITISLPSLDGKQWAEFPK